jgi:hypothetical protein
MNFTDSLDRRLEDVKRPPVLPVGHYVCAVFKHPDLEDFESKKTGVTFDRVTFTMSVLSPHDDVDPDELAAFGNVSGGKLRHTYLFSRDEDDKANYDRSMYNLKRFLSEHLGLGDDMALNEALAASVGAQCLVEVKHRADPLNPEIVYDEAGRTAPL